VLAARVDDSHGERYDCHATVGDRSQWPTVDTGSPLPGEYGLQVSRRHADAGGRRRSTPGSTTCANYSRRFSLQPARHRHAPPRTGAASAGHLAR